MSPYGVTRPQCIDSLVLIFARKHALWREYLQCLVVIFAITISNKLDYVITHICEQFRNYIVNKLLSLFR